MKTHKKLIIAISLLLVFGAVGTVIAAFTVWTPITDVTITSPENNSTVHIGKGVHPYMYDIDGQ